jgi:putative DNA primase/helicase
LTPVALTLHEAFPDKPIVIAGDNDRHLKKEKKDNIGKTKAREAAEAVNGKAVFPEIRSWDLKPGLTLADTASLTDFNDLATVHKNGLQGVKRQVEKGYVAKSLKERAKEAVLDVKERALEMVMS